MRRTFASIAIAMLALTTAANADSPKLKGDYAFTGSASCLDAVNGFDANLQAIPNPPGSPTNGYFSSTFSIEGVRTFNGDGTGSVKARAVAMILPPFASGPGAASIDVTFSFTYAVDGAGGFTSELVPGTFVGTYLTGPRTGQTDSIDKLPLSGLIGNDASVLTLASVVPTVEKQTFSNGDVRYRICHRSRVLVRMSPSKDDKDGDDDHGHGH
jgi:hypothetical protein